MEAKCATPSLPAPEVEALLESDEDVVVLDVRPFNEYHRMSIPGGINVPGVELLHHVADIVPNPNTKIVVNCAGRTRGLLGTQSLINAGIPNSVTALRNGTIGWLLAGQNLETSQSRTYSAASQASLESARIRARAVADLAGVGKATQSQIEKWASEAERTTYFFDVRSRVEYEAGHDPRFFGIEGGQLIQETEVNAPVRGARIVVMDDDGVRANMTASWLAQMDWDVYVVELRDLGCDLEIGTWHVRLPDPGAFVSLQIDDFLSLNSSETKVSILNFSQYASYLQGHIPGAIFVLRSQLKEAINSIPRASVTVITDDDGILSQYVASELSHLVDGEIVVLHGGNSNWQAQGLDLESGPTNVLSPPIDRYRRPYVGTDISAEKMQAYLDWEFGLIEQLDRDGTHHFRPVTNKGQA
jgi:rhodanese-related sulfurtransferase